MYQSTPVMYSGVPFTPPLQTTDKGKGKSREIDFEAAFAQMAETLESNAKPEAQIEELDDTADLAAAMTHAKIDGEEARAAGVQEAQDTVTPDFKESVSSILSIPP